MVHANRRLREKTREHERSDALLDGSVITSKHNNTSTTSSRAKGKGKAMQDVNSDEKVTLPSLKQFTFKLLPNGHFVRDEVNDNEFISEPGPLSLASNIQVGMKRKDK